MGAIISFSSQVISWSNTERARQMTQYNCCGKNKCSLRYWSSYFRHFNTEEREEYLFILAGSLRACHLGLLKTFSTFCVFPLPSPHTSYFSHAVPLNIVSPLEQLSLFSTRAKKAEQQFYKKNKQSSHPFDIVLLKKRQSQI